MKTQVWRSSRPTTSQRMIWPRSIETYLKMRLISSRYECHVKVIPKTLSRKVWGIRTHTLRSLVVNTFGPKLVQFGMLLKIYKCLCYNCFASGVVYMLSLEHFQVLLMHFYIIVEETQDISYISSR